MDDDRYGSPACCSTPPRPPSGLQLVLRLADHPALNELDGSAVVNSPRGPLILIRLAPTTLLTLSRICPNAPCGIIYYSGLGELRCLTCGSRFSCSGQVVFGPATRSLASFPTTESGGVVVVDLT